MNVFHLSQPEDEHRGSAQGEHAQPCVQQEENAAFGPGMDSVRERLRVLHTEMVMRNRNIHGGRHRGPPQGKRAQPHVQQEENAAFGPGMDSVRERLRVLHTEIVMRNRNIHGERHAAAAVLQPSPITPARANVIERGGGDNRGLFERCFAGYGGSTQDIMLDVPTLDPLLPSVLRYIDCPPFTREAMNAFALDNWALIVAHIVCALRVPRAIQQKQLLILEVIAPEIPTDMVMEQELARTTVTAILRNYTAIRDNGWIQDMMAAAAAANPDVGEQHWLRRFNRDAATYGWLADTTLEEMLDYFLNVARYANDRQQGRSLSVILTTFAAFALRGSITYSKLTRCVKDLQPVISYAAEAINAAEISMTWATFGHFVDNGSMPGIMRRWLEFVPAGAIRLRVILSQAAGSGMTSLDVIARAVHEHPEFPWPLVIRMYPQEWIAAQRALIIVGGNPYYGYRRVLTEVRSTKFKYLASICGKLLVAAGDKSLDGYRGFAEDRVNNKSIRWMIDGYMASHAGADPNSAISEEEHESYRSMRDLAALHPANINGHANMGGHPDVPNDQAALATAGVDN
nr:uncharacterized protein si:dkey-81e3.2 [Misgurnus anguillicaudatus]XP_055068188.1 uncharacterized protein si:dkey-81e3.2 [Misgurnus anguillicaudatus]